MDTGPSFINTSPPTLIILIIAEKQIITNSGFTPRIIIENGTFDSFIVEARNTVAIPRLNKLFGKNKVITKSNVPKSFTRASSL